MTRRARPTTVTSRRTVGQCSHTEASIRTRYPEVHDWLLRKAMVCEAHGETELAIEYCERTIAWMDAHPADFDPESRKPFCKWNYVFD